MVTFKAAGKSKQVIANQKRMAANAWRDAKSASARDRLREKYKRDGWSAADIKAIMAAAKSGPRATVIGLKKDPQGLKRTFTTRRGYSGKTTKHRPLSDSKKQRGR